MNKGEIDFLHNSLLDEVFWKIKDGKVKKRVNNKYHFFYDESNNSCSFSYDFSNINQEFNSDPFEDFTLAGLMFLTKPEDKTIDEYRTRLKLQPTVKEIHAVKLFKGDFLEELNSPRFTEYLNILKTSGCMLHFSFLNKLFFGIVDIIENLPPFNGFADAPLHALTTIFYTIVSSNLDSFKKIFNHYKFPKIEKTELVLFYDEIIEQCKNLYSLSKPLFSMLFSSEDDVDKSFKELCLHLNSIHLIDVDNFPILGEDKLISDFSSLYLQNMFLFNKSVHYFDQCQSIKDGVDSIFGNNKKIKYQFLDSKTSVWIQLSDVFANFLGKLVKYQNGKSLNQLKDEERTFSERQKNNLKILREIGDQSLSFHPGLFHYVAPLNEIAKLEYFLMKNSSEDFYSLSI